MSCVNEVVASLQIMICTAARLAHSSFMQAHMTSKVSLAIPTSDTYLSDSIFVQGLLLYSSGCFMASQRKRNCLGMPISSFIIPPDPDLIIPQVRCFTVNVVSPRVCNIDKKKAIAPEIIKGSF